MLAESHELRCTCLPEFHPAQGLMALIECTFHRRQIDGAQLHGGHCIGNAAVRGDDYGRFLTGENIGASGLVLTLLHDPHLVPWTHWLRVPKVRGRSHLLYIAKQMGMAAFAHAALDGTRHGGWNARMMPGPV